MISVIVPVYNEEKNLTPINSRLIEILSKLNKEYEIIYIDDCSKDASYGVLRELANSNNRLKIISLSRNFGQTLAVQAGIDNAQGDILVFMDADMQNDPADIPKLLSKIEEGYDVVSGWRRQRKDPFLNKKLPSFIANSLISFLFKTRIHDLGCALKAYKKEVFSNIRLYGEMHRLLPLYAAINGASIAEVEVRHNSRPSGKSHYGWSRLFKVSLDLVTVRFFEGYATKPIYFFGGIGVFFLSMGMLAGIIVIVRKILFQGIWISPLLFTSFLFVLVGMQLILIGLLAEITIRIYYKSANNPTYIIRDKH
ncbi:MAG: glycosyltransferase family 2 protein [Candidatus Omnitrophota bacterium]|jgi:glycosyltransferase involved in cell wall biosynthesis